MMASSNISIHLTRMAEQQPASDAVLSHPRRNAAGKLEYSRCSYKQLEKRSVDIAAGLATRGVTTGMRVALCVRPGVEFFAITFALFKLGAVPVLIDPGIGLRNFGRCLSQSKPETFIAIPLVHAVRRLLGWAKESNRLNITTGRFGGISLREIETEGAKHGTPPGVSEASTAAILFTSGSTGPAKGVVYTHDNFQAQIDALKTTYNIRPGEIDLATFPLFGLFGPALGMTTVIPAMDFTRPGFVDPLAIIEPIQQLEITNLFGSPALIDRVGRYGEKHAVKLPSLKRVISAGAPVPAAVLERFTKMLLPPAQIFTPYGATEALPVASIGSIEILRDTREKTDNGAGVCVGRTVNGVEAKIIRITDQAILQIADVEQLPAQEVGEIIVRGPVVTREYFSLPEATERAKISDSAGGFYHRMGDAGYFDDAGSLWFCGRKSQRVMLPSGDLFSTPFEAVFNTHPAVRRSALVGVKREGKMLPVICVEINAESAHISKVTLCEELLRLGARHEHTRVIHDILFHPRFPVDIRHNAKINREQLAAWAQRKLS